MKFARLVFARSAFAMLGVVLQGGYGAGTQAAPVQAASIQTRAKSTIKARQLVDVNHATLDELKSLPGIQDAFAAKIVTNRPYANKTQLSTKGVLPAATYARIRALIIAKQ